MSNSVRGNQADAGAVAFGGHNNAASAQFQVGSIGFGPQWTAEDAIAASIIRLEQENEELRAEVAMAEAERIEMAKMLRSEREAHASCQNERDGYACHLNQVCEELGMGDGYIAVDAAIMAAAKIKRLEETVESLRDERCRDKCRDKAAADGGWANI